MKNDEVKVLSGGRKLLLGVFALSTVCVPVLVGVMTSKTAIGAEASTSVAANQVGKIELLPGKRVRLKFKNVEVRSLLKAMAAAGQVNILVGDKVSGTVTLDLAEMPWDQALDIILQSQGLEKQEKNGIVLIALGSMRQGLELASLSRTATGQPSGDPC